MKYYFIMLLALLKCISSFGQGLDASPVGVMISHGHPKGGFMFSYSYMNMMMKDNLSGTAKVSDDAVFLNYIMSPDKMKMDMHMLMAMYGCSKRFSVMAMADYHKMSMDMNMLPGTMHMHGTEMIMNMSTNMNSATSGFGDIKLWALYKALNGEGSSLVFSGGINIPTGRTDLNGGGNIMIGDERLPYMMQLGSGTVDFMPGITFFKKIKKVSWSVQCLSIIRPFDNSMGYHYGNEVTVNAWGAYQLCPMLSASLRTQGSISGAIEGRDNTIWSGWEPDADPRNYGGQIVNGFVGLNIYFNKGFIRDSKVGVEYGIPFYQNLNGPQLALTSVLSVGLTKSF